MIYIGKPYVISDEYNAYLKAKIEITADTAGKWMDLELPKAYWRLYEDYPPASWDETGELNFKVDKEYENYLCDDRADCFVVAFLYYAMMTGSDIKSEAPVSEKLLFGIENHLFPALLKENKGYKKINVYSESIKTPYQTENKVATGMSCGVDSLYSLKKYNQNNIPEQYRLTHLTYFNMGSIFHPNMAENKQYHMDEFYRLTDEMSKDKMINAKNVADKVNMPLVYIESNIDKDYYRGGFGYTAVYRNCAMVLALQGLFGKYYCSSAGWPDFFELNLEGGSEHYETLLCSVFSNGTVEFIISDYASRFEKTKELADYDIAKEYLDVCYNFNSCGKCSKCKRTLLTIDVLGKIDAFGKIFDIDNFKANRTDAYLWLLKAKGGSATNDAAIFAREIYEKANAKGIIPEEAFKEYNKEISKHKLLRVKHIPKIIIKKILTKFHLYK